MEEADWQALYRRRLIIASAAMLWPLAVFVALLIVRGLSAWRLLFGEGAPSNSIYRLLPALPVAIEPIIVLGIVPICSVFSGYMSLQMAKVA